MNIPSSETVAAPTSQESVPGGSYIPKQQDGSTWNNAFSEMVGRGSKGQASHVNDFDLTMSGIAYGDPVGLETFDLGFFEDGTPGITINGANVPIRHDQWMALLSARNRTREELKQRVEFQTAVTRGRSAIDRVVRSGIALPPGMAELISAQNEIDPGKALENLSKVYQAVSVGKGNEMTGDVAAQMQEWKNSQSFDFLTRKGPKTKRSAPNPVDPRLPPVEVEVDTPSIRDSRVEALRNQNTAEAQITMLAYEKLDDFKLDPSFRKMYPRMRMGIFDRISMFEQDKYSPLSLMSRLQHIAAYNEGDLRQVVPMQIPSQSVLRWTGPAIMSDYAAMQEFRKYLVRLDQFAAGAFGYDASSKESIDAVLNDMLSIYTSPDTFSQQAPGAAPQQPAAQPKPRTPSRPRATRTP